MRRLDGFGCGFPSYLGPLALAGLLAAAGCGDDQAGDGDEGVATEDGGGDGDGDGDGDGGGDGGLGFDGVPAGGGISIQRVEFNQGVGVDVARDGEWQEGADRIAPLLRDRRAIVRAFWDIPDDWEPREIGAVLHLRDPDGTLRIYPQSKLIDGPASPADLANGAFGFLVPAEEVVAGMEFQVSLWESDASRSGADAPVLAMPEWAPVGVEAAPLELKAVIVPVDYDDPNSACRTDTRDLTEAEFAGFANMLADMNPVQSVDVVMRSEPIVRTGTINSPGNFFSILQQMRIDDGAEPNVYYYALYDNCSGPAGTLGAAPGASNVTPTKEAAPGRVAAGRWFGTASGSGTAPISWETFVHEIGHTQGREHSPCGTPGNFPANPDPGYPHEGGAIGQWGVNTRTLQQYGPTSAFDYMGYCNPSWVSDYVWRQTFSQIRALTSWDYEDGGYLPEGHVLQGLLYPDGSQEWWTAQGRFAAAPTSPEDTVTLHTLEHGELTLPASVREVPDAESFLRYVTVQLPAPLDIARPMEQVESITLLTRGELHQPLPVEINYELSN